MKRFLLVVLLLGAVTLPGLAQSVTGVVVDSASNTRIAAARVLMLQEDSSYVAITDSTGKFRIRAKPGPFRLHVSALGYEELQSTLFTLKKNESLNVLALLGSNPINLLPVIVAAKSRRPLNVVEAFYDRMKHDAGFGYFFDQHRISKMPWAMTVTDVLSRIPGATLNHNNNLSESISLRPGCTDVTYLLNGLPIIPTEQSVGTVTVDSLSGSMQPVVTGPVGTVESATDVINTMVAPGDIVGIEVYRSDAGLPGALTAALSGARAGTCGLIAIWTKR